jgi:hypothetical protein
VIFCLADIGRAPWFVSPIELGLEISAKVKKTIDRDRGIAPGLREDERTLDDGLGEEREAFRRERSGRSVSALRIRDVASDRRRVGADVVVARRADGGMRVVSLLHHRAEKAREVGQSPRIKAIRQSTYPRRRASGSEAL